MKKNQNNCRWCKKPLNKYQKFYCSRQCMIVYQGKIMKPFKGKHHTKKSKEKMRKTHLGKLLRKSGQRINDGHGYIFIFKPNHPYANGIGYVREHRLIMEKHLGRYLKPTEIVHHVNEIKNDNRLENLMLFQTKKKHFEFHWNFTEYIVQTYGTEMMKDYIKWLKTKQDKNNKCKYIRKLNKK